ncbi:hypothetical protein SDC9_112086 [bioreactor metagenome]|uniref:Uncharacterized protein n=1 Tax=bioreactor metagenome TaxID=1076179 RepID=A0A645BTR3_9ZZZZ
MKKRILLLVLVLVILTLSLLGCREAERVTYNVQKEADYFNVERRLSVINARTDKPLFEMVGYFSISNNATNELVVTCQTGENEFRVNYIYLNEWTLYVVEDISGAHVDKYHYEINFLPEMILPVTFTSND